MLSEQLLADLLALPEADRAELIAVLEDSFGPPPEEDIPEDTRKLLDERLAEVEANPGIGRSANEVFASIRDHLRQIRQPAIK